MLCSPGQSEHNLLFTTLLAWLYCSTVMRSTPKSPLQPMTSRHETGSGGCRSWPRGVRDIHNHGLRKWHEYIVSCWCLRTHRLSTKTSQWTSLQASRRLESLSRVVVSLPDRRLVIHSLTAHIELSNLYSKKAGCYRFWILTRHQTVWVVALLSFWSSVGCKIFSSFRFAVLRDRLREVQLCQEVQLCSLSKISIQCFRSYTI